MQNKEELKKQVIILTVILLLVIVMAVILNTNKKTNIRTIDNASTIVDNENFVPDVNEDLKNLKGLIQEETKTENKTEDKTNKNKTKSQEKTLTEPVNTGKKETITTQSGEQINYEEIIYGDN